MTAKLAEWAAFIEGLFAHVHVIALLLGLGVGLSLSQALKFPIGAWLLPKYSPAFFRWTVRAVGFCTAAVTTAIAWPNSYGFAWGLLIGGCVAPAYWLGMKAIGRWLPWASVTKAPPPAPDTRPAEVRAAENHDGLNGGA